jgi:hypothetical protein
MAKIRVALIAVAAVCLGSASALAGAPVVAPPAGAVVAQEFLVTADGRRVAFDDTVLDGARAIRLFDANGALVRELDLIDFLPGEFVAALPRTGGHLRWRGAAVFAASQDSLEFSVRVPGASGDAQAAPLLFSIDLQDGLVRTSQIREYLAAADRARALGAGTAAGSR